MEKFFVVSALCITLYELFFRRYRYGMHAAALSMVVMLVIRSVKYSHFPVLGLLETLNFFALSLTLIFLAMNKQDNDGRFGLFARLFIAILLGTSCFAATGSSPFLPDSLDTVLFPLHVAFSFISYAFFTLAFFRMASGGESNVVADLNYLGFLTFTIGLWTGGIWGYKAWGAYFLFSIKEIFSFTLWLFYAGLIHVRFFRERDALMRICTAAGFLLMLFTYIGIGLFMKNTHSLG